MKSVRVDLDKRAYNINIAPELLSKAGHLLEGVCAPSKVVVISNPTIMKYHGKALLSSLEEYGFKAGIIEVPDGESYKTLETAGELYNKLAELHAERGTPIIAFGGGVIGDLAGFTAATYQRGVPFIQIPTTLLSQVDSSIGGKVAVNHGKLKNNVGAFYQPLTVISDTETLKTLPKKEFRSGLAEVIKSAVIKSETLFAYLEANLKSILNLNDEALAEIVFQTAKIKASVVEQDETDGGIRNILNFGHTIGHAIETVSNFSVSHGEAVAIGMVKETEIAVKLGILESSKLIKLSSLIEKAGLPVKMPKLDTANLIKALMHDKKTTGGKIKIILPEKIGEVIIYENLDPKLIEEVLSDAS